MSKVSEAGSTNSLAALTINTLVRNTEWEQFVQYLGSQKTQVQVRRESVPSRYPSLNLELRWLTPGTNP